MDIYVVLDGPVLVGVSARLQGAEEIRSNWAAKLADQSGKIGAARDITESLIYDRQQIINTELQDAE